MSESETTGALKSKVIRDGEAGRRGMRWEKVSFTFGLLDFFQFVALKGLRRINTLSAKWVIFYYKNTFVQTPLCMSESETTSASNWKVIRESDKGR